MSHNINLNIQNSLVKKLSRQWDLRIGPFRAFFSDEQKHIEKCEEVTGIKASPSGVFAICQNTHNGNIVACLYLEDATEMSNNEEKRKAFNLDLLGKTWVNKMVIMSNLSFVTITEKTLISQTLVSHCLIEVLKVGGQAILADCDVGIFSLYKRLGMRPIGVLYKYSLGGHYIPMIFHPDEDYLTLINSPVMNILRRVDFSAYRELCEWYYQLVRENHELQVGSAYYPESEAEFEGHQTITEGMSKAGREAFLKNGMVLKCRENEVLMTETDGSKSFGFIQNGTVKVVIGGKTVVLLTQGDIFGEIGFILNTRRTAQVVAVSSDTEVVLFGEQAIDDLKNESDKTAIWWNLSKVLAQRVVMTNKLLG